MPIRRNNHPTSGVSTRSLTCSRRNESAMFQDALVESSGKLQSKSKRWLPATLFFNLALVATAILIPLLHPEALPRTALTATLTVPPPPPPSAAPQPQTVRTTRAPAPLNPMQTPTRIPREISTEHDAPPPATTGAVSGAMQPGEGVPSGILTALAPTTTPIVIERATPKPHQPDRIRLSSGVAAGAILTKTTPTYPAIAKAAHVSGAVLLHAVISKSGTIESLQVVSGPEMLRSSALDAVRQWRYRPYLLNGEPTEVETSITVNFNFGG